jgi:hypothetical protein
MSRIKSKGKAAKYYQSIKEDRAEWARSRLPFCMSCGCKGGFTGLQIHEITRRAQASTRWACRSSYLLLCQSCHESDFASMAHTDQLAIKKVKDPEYYDLQKWLRISDPELKAPRRVTEEEVSEAVVRIFGSCGKRIR